MWQLLNVHRNLLFALLQFAREIVAFRDELLVALQFLCLASYVSIKITRRWISRRTIWFVVFVIAIKSNQNGTERGCSKCLSLKESNTNTWLRTQKLCILLLSCWRTWLHFCVLFLTHPTSIFVYVIFLTHMTSLLFYLQNTFNKYWFYVLFLTHMTWLWFYFPNTHDTTTLLRTEATWLC